MRNIALFAATVALVTSLPAVAASSANATLGNLTVTLFDLNPGDGVGALIAFHSDEYNPYGSYASSSASDAASGSQNGSAWSLTPFDPVNSVSTVGGAAAAGSVSGSLAGGGVSFAAAGSAAGALLPGFGSNFQASARSGNGGSLSFSLSPYTLAVFSGTATLSALTTVGTEQGTDGSERAGVSVSLSVNGPAASGSGSGSQNSFDSYSLSAGTVYDYDYETGLYHYSGEYNSIAAVSLAASFTNASANTLNGTLSASAMVDGYSSVTAVPEPGTYALLLAGLAAVGSIARRRRSN